MDQQHLNNDKGLEGIDIDKLVGTVKRSWPYILLIVLVTNLTAYLIIRWTKPLYESTSELKLDVEAKASEFGLSPFVNPSNTNVISGEIELLKSKLFFNKVIDSIDLDISYYTAGNVLNDEKYNSSPFKVDYKIKDNQILDKRIYLEIEDRSFFKISFEGEDMANAKQYKFGEYISYPQLDLTVTLTNHYQDNKDFQYFFRLNSRGALINYIAGNIVVEPLNLSANTIKISFKDFNKNKAVKLVNTIDSVYLKYTEEEKNRENKNKIEWLNNELNTLEGQLENYETYFEDFTIQNRTNDLNADLKRTLEALNQLDSQKYILTKRLMSIDLGMDKIMQEIANTDVIQSSYPQFILKNLIELNGKVVERQRLSMSHSETTFVIASRDQEISDLRKVIASQLSELKKKYSNDLKEISVRRNRLFGEFEKLPKKNTDYNKNQRFFKLSEEFYLSLMQSKAQYQIAQAGITTQFKILSPASVPGSPVSPNGLIIHGIGFITGFIFSLIFVGLRYLLHNKIGTVAELEKYTDSPILGAVPKATIKLEQTSLIVHKKPKSAVSESLRTIRTNIEFMVSQHKKRVISVTSTISGEGKTFIAVNLGGIIAMSKKKTVIVDLDMRKPRVHAAFGSESAAKGVSTILINKSTIQECIRETAVDGLHYIPAGPTPPNPSELLLNDEFESLINSLHEEYDLVILDTPPVGLVTDGILAMKKAHLALYIVRANFSKKSFISTLNRLLNVNQFKNLSVILNVVPRAGNKYGYGYGGYGYYDEKPLEPEELTKI